MTKEEFYNKVYTCKNEEYTISFIIETLDDLHSKGNFSLSDEIIDIDPTKHTTPVLITLLVITFPAKKELKNRDTLFIKTKEHLLNTVGVTETHGLLIGLN
jgi:hypothetical protein